MSQYHIYDTILQEVEEPEALAFAAGYCFEGDTVLHSIKYAEHVETINGVGVYYDYGADYYFFTEEEADTHENIC